MNKSALGPVSNRVKTDIRLPKALVMRLNEMCDLLGVSKNVFITIASAKLCIDMAGMHPQLKKRSALLRDMRQLVNDIIDYLEKDQ